MPAWLVTLALVVGCSSGKPSAREHRVEIRAMQFVPAQLDVAVGDTVVWTNVDLVPHTVTSASGVAAPFDSAAMQPHQQYTLKVQTAGELPYVCTYHPTMKGTLVAR